MKHFVCVMVAFWIALAGQACLAAGIDKLAYARKFTGPGNFFSTTSNPAIGTGDFSIACFVRTDVMHHPQVIMHTGSFEQQINKLSGDGSYFDNNGILLWITADDEIAVRLVTQGSHKDCLTTGDAVGDLDWHHVCVTAERDNSGADNVKIYIDGTLNSTTDVITELTDGSLTSTLGVEVGARHTTFPTNGLFPLYGAIAGLRIWNAELDVDEVGTDYNGGDGRVYQSQIISSGDSTLHAWDLQEDSGNASDDDTEGTLTLTETGTCDSTFGPGFHPNVVAGMVLDIRHSDHTTKSGANITNIQSSRHGYTYNQGTGAPDAVANGAKVWGGVETATYVAANSDFVDGTFDTTGWTSAYAIVSALYTSGNGYVLNCRGASGLSDHHPLAANSNIYTSFFSTTRQNAAVNAEVWSNPHIVEFGHNGTNLIVEVNDTSVINTATTFTATMVDANQTIGVGYDGTISDVIVYDNYPSATDRARIYDWVNWRVERNYHYTSQHSDSLVTAEAALDDAGDVYLVVDSVAGTAESLAGDLVVPSTMTVNWDEPDYRLINNSNSITFNGPVRGFVTHSTAGEAIIEWTDVGDELDFEDTSTYVSFGWFEHTGQTDEAVRAEIVDEILYSAAGADPCRNFVIPEMTVSWDTNYQLNSNDDDIQIFGVDRHTSILDCDVDGIEMIYKPEAGSGPLDNVGVFDLTLEALDVTTTSGVAIVLEGNNVVGGESTNHRIGRITADETHSGIFLAGGDVEGDKSIYQDCLADTCASHGFATGAPGFTNGIRLKAINSGGRGLDLSGGGPVPGSAHQLDVLIDGMEILHTGIDASNLTAMKIGFDPVFAAGGDASDPYFTIEYKNLFVTCDFGVWTTTGNPEDSSNCFLTIENAYADHVSGGSTGNAWTLSDFATVDINGTFEVTGHSAAASGMSLAGANGTSITYTVDSAATVNVYDCGGPGIYQFQNVDTIINGTVLLDGNVANTTSSDPGQYYLSDTSGAGSLTVAASATVTIQNSGPGEAGEEVYGMYVNAGGGTPMAAGDLDLDGVTFDNNEGGGIFLTGGVSNVADIANLVFTDERHDISPLLTNAQWNDLVGHTDLDYASDKFTRGDSDSLGTANLYGRASEAWTEQHGDLDISSNRIVTAGSDPGGGGWVATVDVGAADVEIVMTFQVEDDETAGAVLRWVDDDNYWYVEVTEVGASTDTIRLYERNAGTDTEMGTAVTNLDIEPATDYTLRVTVTSASVIATFVTDDAGEQTGPTVTDTTHDNNNIHGVQSSHAGTQFDDFAIRAE